MADNYDVGSLVASIQLDVSNLQRDISSATSAFSNLGGKIDSMATSVTRSEGYLKNMSSQMGNMRDDMLQYTIAIESAIRSLPASFQQAGTGSAAGMRIMQESMEAAKATSYTLNTVIASQLEALTAKVNAQTAQIASSFEKLGKSMSSSLEAGFAKVTGGTSLSGIASKLSSAETGMKGIQRETRNTASAMDLLADRIKNANSSFTSFTSGAMGKIRGLTTDLFFLQMMTQQIGSAFEFAFGQGIKFSIEMENALMGIGGIIASSMTMDGKDIQFDQGMALASKAAERLRVAALTTTVSMSELMGVFQAIVGPASALGMSFDDIIDFSVFGSTAVKALGLRKDQLVQELRSIVTGNITARSSTLATALGITNEDIENAKSQVGGVFAFLQQRMAGFAELSKQQGASFEAIWTNIQDGIQQTQEQAFMGLFSALKRELAEVQSIFFTITKGEDGKEITVLNPNTVETFRQVAALVQVVYEDIKNWATELSNNDTFIARIYATLFSARELIEYIYSNFTDIAGDLAIIYALSGGWMRLISVLIVYFDKIPEALEFVKEHLDTILILMGLWIGVFSPLTQSLLFAIELYKEIKILQEVNAELTLLNTVRSFSFAGAVGGVATAFEAVGITAGTAFATIATGLIMVGSLVAGVTAALYLMHKAMANEAPETRQQRFDEAGVGNMTLFEYDPSSNKNAPSPANLKMPENYDYETKMDRYARESRELLEKMKKDTADALKNSQGQLAAKYPPTEKAPKGGAGKGAGDAVRAEMAEIEGALKEKNAAIKDILDELKYEYQEHDISIKTYFTEAAELTQQLTLNEIDALNQKIAVATKESDVVKYQAELKLKMQQMNKEQIKLLREEAKALKDLDKTLSEYAATAAERSGDFEKAAEIKVNKQYEDVLKGFNAEIITYEANLDSLSVAEKARLVQLKDAVKTIGDIVISTKTKGALDTINLEQKTAENAQAARKVALDKQLKEGLISEIEYKQKIIDSNNQYADTIEALIPKLEALSLKEGLSATEKQEYAAAITNLKAKLVELKEPLSAIAKQVKSDFQDATATAFEAVIMRTKKVSDAFADMAKAILASLAKIAANRLASSIATGLFSIFGGGTNTATAGISSGYYTGTLGSTSSWSTAFSHANGGQITGPGTGTSDSIPSMLSNGEFVIRAASVSKIGKNALEYINNFGSLPKLHYAEGGMVGNSSSSATSLSNLKVEIVNNSGNQLNVTNTNISTDPTETIISIVIDGVNRNVGGANDFFFGRGGR